MWIRLLILLFIACPISSCAQREPIPPTTQPFPGVVFEHRADQTPPLHLYIARIDLTNPKISIRAVPAALPETPDNQWPAALEQPTVVAEREKFDLAVNGDFFASKNTRNMLGRNVPYFAGNPAHPVGSAVTDGKTWRVGNEMPALIITKSGAARIENCKTPPPDAWQLVCGGNWLIKDGKNVAPSDPEQAPRTAVGLDAANKTLVILVADGRNLKHSVGLSLFQLADELKKLNCATGINLDGGGSSAFVMKNPSTGKINLLSRPSDGHDLPISLSQERTVCQVLGITFKKD